MHFPKTLASVISSLLLLSLTGCFSRMGPRTVETTFPHYGEAIHTVVHEDLLRNLVRRSFQEAPQFLALGNVTQTRSVSTNVNVGTSFNRLGFLLANGEAGTSTTDYPTFSILPQQGPEFAEKLHERLPLKVLPQLTNAGYPVELVFTLLVQEMAGVPGVYLSSGDSFRPGSPRFNDMLNSMKALEDRNHLKIENVVWEEPSFSHPFAPEVFSPADIMKTGENGKRYASLDGGQTFFVTSQEHRPALWISPEARLTGPGRELLSFLKLDPQASRKAWLLEEVRYVDGRDASNARDSIAIRTRSFYGVLNLLSHGIRRSRSPESAPAVDQGYGKAVAAGLAPDIASRFMVHSGPLPPRSAFISVKSHGGWYWIDSQDAASKQLFNALFDLYQLQIPFSGSENSTSTPLLSISTP